MDSKNDSYDFYSGAIVVPVLDPNVRTYIMAPLNDKMIQNRRRQWALWIAQDRLLLGTTYEESQQRWEEYQETQHPASTIVADIATTYARLKEMMEEHGQTMEWTVIPQIYQEVKEIGDPAYPPSRLYSSLQGDTEGIADWVGRHGRTPNHRLGQYDEPYTVSEYESEIRYSPLLRDLRANHGQGAESEDRQVGDSQTDRTDFIPAIWCNPTA